MSPNQLFELDAQQRSIDGGRQKSMRFWHWVSGRLPTPVPTYRLLGACSLAAWWPLSPLIVNSGETHIKIHLICDLLNCLANHWDMRDTLVNHIHQLLNWLQIWWGMSELKCMLYIYHWSKIEYISMKRMERYNYGGLQYSIVSKNKKKNKKKGVQLTPGVIHHSLSFLRLVTKTRLVLPWCEYHVGRLYRHVQSTYTLYPGTCYSSIFKKAIHKKGARVSVLSYKQERRNKRGQQLAVRSIRHQTVQRSPSSILSTSSSHNCRQLGVGPAEKHLTVVWLWCVVSLWSLELAMSAARAWQGGGSWECWGGRSGPWRQALCTFVLALSWWPPLPVWTAAGWWVSTIDLYKDGSPRKSPHKAW